MAVLVVCGTKHGSRNGLGDDGGTGLLGTVIFAEGLVEVWCRWEDLLPFWAA